MAAINPGLYTPADSRIALNDLDSIVEHLLKSEDSAEQAQLVEILMAGAPASEADVSDAEMFSLIASAAGMPPSQEPPPPSAAPAVAPSEAPVASPPAIPLSWSRSAVDANGVLWPSMTAPTSAIMGVTLTRPFLRDEMGHAVWYKTWRCPEVHVSIAPSAPAGSKVLLRAATIAEGTPSALVDVRLRGETHADVVAGAARFSGVMFESTSFNCAHANFHLVVQLCIDGSATPPPGVRAECWVSEGVRVQSKRPRPHPAGGAEPLVLAQPCAARAGGKGAGGTAPSAPPPAGAGRRGLSAPQVAPTSAAASRAAAAVAAATAARDAAAGGRAAADRPPAAAAALAAAEDESDDKELLSPAMTALRTAPVDARHLRAGSVSCDGPAPPPAFHLSEGVSGLVSVTGPIPHWLSRATCMPDSPVVAISMTNVSSSILYMVAQDPAGAVSATLPVSWCSSNMDSHLGAPLSADPHVRTFLTTLGLFDVDSIGSMLDALRALSANVDLSAETLHRSASVRDEEMATQASAYPRVVADCGTLRLNSALPGLLACAETQAALYYAPVTERLTLFVHFDAFEPPSPAEDDNDHFRAMCDESFDCFKFVDARGWVTFVSAASCVLFGYEPFEHVGAPTGEFLHPEDQHLIRERVSSSARGGPLLPMLPLDTPGTSEWTHVDVAEDEPGGHGGGGHGAHGGQQGRPADAAQMPLHPRPPEGARPHDPDAVITSRLRGVLRHRTWSGYRYIDFVATFKWQRGVALCVTMQVRPSVLERRSVWDSHGEKHDWPPPKVR